MKADLSRDTFRPQNGYARVVFQQGHLVIDADLNEQTAILLHQTRALAADMIGPHGGPGSGFRVTCSDDLRYDFLIGYGRYYVDGILCELEPLPTCPVRRHVAPVRYTAQPDFPVHDGGRAALEADTDYLIYLDVWERHLSSLQAEWIGYPATGEAETTTRTKTVCQVKALALDERERRAAAEILEAKIKEPQVGCCMRARARDSARAGYGGSENHLYRVEIHDPGTATGGSSRATFKWSRENGSIIYGIRRLQGNVATLTSPIVTHDIRERDWFEIVDDYSELRSEPRALLQVNTIDGPQIKLTVPPGVTLPVFNEDSTTHPLLRRWDQQSDAIPVREGEWIDLEDGVQVWFEAGGTYRAGDYWMIPARSTIADVLWPLESSGGSLAVPTALPPNGISHHFAPLARISIDANGVASCSEDCRRIFEPLASGRSERRERPFLFDRLATWLRTSVFR